jgi:hypothetical protein|tara:strand:- start:178 stop:474 length:297 start_codon:yes stop_codon:yes gene_type:complete
MNKILSTLAIAFIGFSFSAFADVSVKGYYKNDGTYVQPHYRSSPNNTTRDNFSTYGNTNPYTGQQGTVRQKNELGTYGTKPRGSDGKPMGNTYYGTQW